MQINFKPGRIYRPPALNAVRLRRFWLPSAQPVPSSYDIDAAIISLMGISIPAEMDDNNTLSCCVEAAKCKGLRRYFALETGTASPVSAADVESNYLEETGGEDDGLIPDQSFSDWATRGISVGPVASQTIHKIIGSARVDATDALDVQRAVWKLGGIFVGGMIPEVWINQTEDWQPLPGSAIAGGHEMYGVAFDATRGLCVETWGRRQWISWPAVSWCFAESNQGEAAAIIRGVESATPVDGLDTTALQTELQQDEEQGS
jgi:hypothetical protein